LFDRNRVAELKPPIEPQKVGVVRELFKHGFAGDEVFDTYDVARSAQFYGIGPSGALRHRVYVSLEFFDDHSLGDIERLLRTWRALETIKQAGARAVIITASGIIVPAPRTS
jgi:hypothetical protein